MNRLSRLYSALFLLPLAGYWISYLVAKPVPENLGNRPLAAWPRSEHVLPTSSWLQKAASYVIERSPFRYRTIQARNSLLLFTAKELYPVPVNPGHADVCYGRNGWLFLLNETPSHRSKENLRDLAKEAVKLARTVRQCGKKFYFVVFPDKMSVYPEYSGWTKKWAERHAGREKLPEELAKTFAKAEDVHDSYIAVLPAMLQAKAQGKGPLYWKDDTHWDDAGIVAATRAMVNGIQPGVFDDSAVVFGGIGGSHETGGGNDLINEFLALDVTPEAPMYSINRGQGLPAVTRRPLADPAYRGQYILHSTSPLPRVIKGKTVLVGDSFAFFAFPIIAPWFEDLTFVQHGMIGTPEMVECLKEGDTIIWTTVERGLKERLDYWTGPFRFYLRAAFPPKEKPAVKGTGSGGP